MKNQAWIKRSGQNHQTGFRLFYFPYTGGGASFFRTWPDRLRSAFEVGAIQVPRREERLADTPFDRRVSGIDALVDVLSPYMDLLFTFFGHSLESLIAFELTRRLRRQKAPCRLQPFVSGRRAPQIPDPDPRIHHLPDKEFIEALRRLKGTPKAALDNPDLMALFWPLLRSDMRLSETYIYDLEDPLDCPISVFGRFGGSGSYPRRIGSMARSGVKNV